MVRKNGVAGALSAAGVIVLMAGLALGADGVVRQGVVHLRIGDVRTADRPNALDGAAFSQKWNVIVIDGPVDPARKALLAGAGVTLAGYLPENAFIADLSGTTPARVKALPFVIWGGPYQKEWKVDAALLAGANGRPFVTQSRQAIAAQGLVVTDVWLFQGEPEAPVRAAIAKLANARVTVSEMIEGGVHMHITLQAKDAPQLAEIPELMFAEHAAEYTPRSNATTRWVIQTDQLNMTPFYDNGITGVGQIVGMIDGGLIVSHCSFFDPAHPIGPLHRKIVASDPNPPAFDPHGTHTSCTAVGDAGDNSDTRGIAYGARMTFQFYPDPTETSVAGRFQFAHDHGARIHSNSWGDDSITTYDGPCRAIDTFQHTNEDDLILFAVTDLNSFVRNPENAKNSLAVSLSGEAPDEMNTCNNYGGHAPTADGRRKPEVMAPGCNIVSAAGGACGTQALTGTSMACPAVAGAAALVREYFMDGFYPSGHARAVDAITPTGSLIKAVLVNGAVDMTGIPDYPSDKEGWGRVLLSGAVPFGHDLRHGLVLSDVRNASGLQTGQSAHVAVYSENCTAPLHVTLAYADFAAQANATFTPVNNLDLVVTSPGGDVYRGNYFVGGVSAPGGAADAINNLEQVIVAAPMPGRWDIAIVGTAVPQGPQGFALVVTGAVDQNACGSADFDCDGDVGTDADIEAFFAALAGGFGDADFNRDGDVGTDADIEAFFRVLGGNPC
jgi:subtilisin family serine protease